MDFFWEEALAQARKSLAEGGIPIGAVLVCDGRIVGRGHNRRLQMGSPILHAEMDAVQNAGRQPASVYRRCTLYTTLSPCVMCSGMLRLYRIAEVVVGEDVNFRGPTEELIAAGIKVRVINDERCILMLREFIRQHPGLWYEDIGEENRRQHASSEY